MQVFLCIRSQSARSLKSCANMEMQRAGRDFRRHPGGTRGKNWKGIVFSRDKTKDMKTFERRDLWNGSAQAP